MFCIACYEGDRNIVQIVELRLGYEPNLERVVLHALARQNQDENMNLDDISEIDLPTINT